MLACAQTTGQVESVDTLEGGDILVSFRSRAAAEQVRTLTCLAHCLLHFDARC